VSELHRYQNARCNDKNYFYDFVTVYFIHIIFMRIILLGFLLCRRIMRYYLWYLHSPQNNNIISCGPLSNTKEVRVQFSLRSIKHHALKTHGVAVHLRVLSVSVPD
jgi:hypothetical protein